MFLKKDPCHLPFTCTNWKSKNSKDPLKNYNLNKNKVGAQEILEEV